MCVRAIARHFGNEQLDSSARTYLISGVIFLGCCVLLPLVMVLVAVRSQSRGPQVAFFMLITVSALGMTVFALFVVLYFLEILARARKTIEPKPGESFDA